MKKRDEVRLIMGPAQHPPTNNQRWQRVNNQNKFTEMITPQLVVPIDRC